MKTLALTLSQTKSRQSRKDWWDSLSPEEQESYLKEHPRSRLKPTKNKVNGRQISEPEEDTEDTEEKLPPELEKVKNKVKNEVKQNEDYRDKENKINSFFSGKSKVSPDLVKTAVAGACVLLALSLAVAMPDQAPRLLGAARVLTDVINETVDAISGKDSDLDDDLSSKKGNEGDENENDEEVVNPEPDDYTSDGKEIYTAKLLPREVDQADERKRILRRINFDENGEPINPEVEKETVKASNYRMLSKKKEDFDFTDLVLTSMLKMVNQDKRGKNGTA